MKSVLKAEISSSAVVPSLLIQLLEKMSCRPKSSARKRIRSSLPQVCVRCGATEKLTLDHIIPRVYGGTNEQSNFQILCLDCNRLKSRSEIRHWNPNKNALKGQLLAATLGLPRFAH